MVVLSEGSRIFVLEKYGLTEEQLDDMLPSEYEKFTDDFIQKKRDARGMIRKDDDESKIGETDNAVDSI